MTDTNVRIVFSGNAASAVAATRQVETGLLGAGKAALKFAGVAAVGVLVADGLKKAIGASIQFQKALADVNKVVNLNDQQLKRVGQTILNVSRVTAQDPSSLAESLKILAAAGFKTHNALGALIPIGKAATATQTDLAAVTKTVAAVLKQYGISATQASHVTDVLVQTVEHGGVGFEDLQTTLTQVLPVAAALKLPFSDLAAVISELGKQQIPASRAAMSLRMMLTALLKPNKDLAKALIETGDATVAAGLKQKILSGNAKESAKALKAAGDISATSALQHKGLAGVLRDLQRVAANNPDLIARWFPSRSSAIVFALTGHMREFTQATEQARAAAAHAGATNEAFAKQMGTLSGQWLKFKNDMRIVGIELGTFLIPALVKGLQGVRQFFAAMAFGAHDWMTKTRAVISTVASAWAGFVRGVQAQGRAVDAAVAAMSAATRAAGAAIRAAVSAIAAAFRAMVSAVTAAIRAVIGAWNTLRSAAGKVIHFLVDDALIKGAMGAIHALESAWNALRSAASSVVHFVTQTSNTVKPNTSPRVRGHATGGVVGGFGSGDTVPALLTPKEIVLNRGQQQNLAGLLGLHGGTSPDALFRMVAHGFASGGVVPAKGRKPPKPKVHKAHIGHPRAAAHASGKKAKALMAGFNADELQAGDIINTFDLMDREFSISVDPYGNALDVNELEQLIAEREKLVAVYQDEMTKLAAAIDAFKKAIKILNEAIKKEREAIAADIKKINELHNQKMPTGKAGTKARAARSKQLYNLNQDLSTRKKNLSGLTGDLNDLTQGRDAAAYNLAHVTPFNLRGSQIDIEELRQQEKDTKASIAAGQADGLAGGDTGAGAGGTSVATGGGDSSLVASLEAMIGRLRLGLELQQVQVPIIGQFKQGTLSVPETGLALVHAGESITPAGYPRSHGSDSGTGGDIQLNVVFDGDLKALGDFVRLKAVEASPAISKAQGREAQKRRREGRY